MKIVFVSNYFNHHQMAFTEEIFNKLRNDFTFISTTTMREERRVLGYSQQSLPGYVLLSYMGVEEYNKAMELIMNADVAIVGSAPFKMLQRRILAGKLVFRYSERPFKMQPSALRVLYFALKSYLLNFPYRNIYMLGASAFTSSDYSTIGMFRNKSYRWGYFPNTKVYDVNTLMSTKRHNKILWCGRFISWKHPDDVLCIAKMLKDNGYLISIDFIGTGEKTLQLYELAQKLDILDIVTFCGPMSPDQVRKQMENAGIYLFTSDRKEGWGAVLNESMNSGCAVIASDAIGSVPYLIQDGENGFIYESGNLEMLYEKVKYLLDNPMEQIRLGEAAYATITEKWNARVAADRFLQLTQKIIDGEKSPDLYVDGPCSKA